MPSKITKKGVTFVSGLFPNERSLNLFQGALVQYEQIAGLVSDEALVSLVFSKFIVKGVVAAKPRSSEKKVRSKEFSVYGENSLNDLMMAATESL